MKTHLLPRSHLLHLLGKIRVSFSLVKSILRSPGGKLFLKLGFILLVRLHGVKIMLEASGTSIELINIETITLCLSSA